MRPFWAKTVPNGLEINPDPFQPNGLDTNRSCDHPTKGWNEDREQLSGGCQATASNSDFTIRRAINYVWNMVSIPPTAAFAGAPSAVVNCRFTGRGQRNTPVAGVRGSVNIIMLSSDDFIPNITNAALMTHMDCSTDDATFPHLRNMMTTNKCSDSFAQMKSSYQISSSPKLVL